MLQLYLWKLQWMQANWKLILLHVCWVSVSFSSVSKTTLRTEFSKNNCSSSNTCFPPFFILFVALIYGQVWGFWSFGFIYCDHHVLSSMYLFSEHAAWAFWPVFSCSFLYFSSFISLTINGLHAFSFLLSTVASFFLFFFGYISSCW